MSPSLFVALGKLYLWLLLTWIEEISVLLLPFLFEIPICDFMLKDVDSLFEGKLLW